MSAVVDSALRADLDSVDAASRFVPVDHGVLHALEFRGRGPTVLVLPGITSPAITWEFVARELTDAGRIVVADLRGRGLSTPPRDGAYGLDAYAADAVALIAGLGLDCPIVIGHSLGARIAAALAVGHPGATRAMLLVDPPLTGPGRAPYPISREAFLQQIHEAQAGTTADAVGRHWPGWPRRELELRARWLATCDERAVAETHRLFEQEDFHALWERLPVATTLMRGGRSPVVTDAGAEELAAARPDVPIVVVADAGHMIPWDDLDGFLGPTRDFLRTAPERVVA